MSALTYPNHPGAKVGGTSQDAADNIAEHAMTLRERVDQLFGHSEGLTADECAARLNESVLAVRPRLSELKRLGRIVETDLRRKNESGMSATVWKRTTPKTWKDDLFA